ncbi:MAG: hypothetical protein ACLVJU_10880 [Blautia sp.]
MSGYNIDVADMQCWVFRMAQSNGKCLQATAQNCLRNTTFSDLLLIATTFFI